MRFWKTIVVIALLVIVGAYALYLGRQQTPSATPKLFKVEAKDIQKIELRGPDRDIVLERGHGDDWNIVKPVQVKADASAAQEMVKAISGLEVTGTAEDKPADLAPFGLANPAVVVTATTKDNHALPGIMVGKDTPVGNSTFIKMTDKPAVLLVSNGFPVEVNKTLDDLRSRTLITFKPEDVDKIVLAPSKGETVELDREGSNWTIVKPQRYLADSSAVQQLLNSLTDARVTDFVEDHPTDLKKYGLSEPSLKVELYTKAGGAEESLLFGEKEPQPEKDAVYAWRGEGTDQPVCTVTNAVFLAANKNFNDLRDKTVLTFDRSKIQRVTLIAGPMQETVERAAGGKWTVTTDGKSAPGETPVAESLLDQFHDLKATKILEADTNDPNRYGMMNPAVTATLYGKDDKQLARLRLSSLQVTYTPKEGGGQPVNKYFGFATTDQGSLVYEIPHQAVNDLENTVNRLHSDVMGTPTPSAHPTALPTPPAR